MGLICGTSICGRPCIADLDRWWLLIETLLSSANVRTSCRRARALRRELRGRSIIAATLGGFRLSRARTELRSDPKWRRGRVKITMWSYKPNLACQW
jgi:hypothetical protein